MNLQVETVREQDALLWRRVLADDQSAFEQVVNRYQNAVSAIAYCTTGNLVLSQDVAQETFWSAWRQRTQLRDHARLASWLCGIARNLALQAVNRESRQPPSVDVFDGQSQFDDPASCSISSEESALVWEALEAIPEKYREALVLYYRDEHSIAAVAAAMDSTVDAIKQRMSRGRQMIRAQLASRIEDVLVRSRPGKSLSTHIMVGIGALATSLKATSTVAAAATGTTALAGVGKAVMSTASTLTAKTAAAGATAGTLGGFAGAGFGLLGAWLGCWLPAQMAPNMAERKLLERNGRRAFVGSLVFTALILIFVLLPKSGINIGPVWYAVGVALSSLIFAIWVILISVKAQRELLELQKSMPDNHDPNPSRLRQTLKLDSHRMMGRKYTSTYRLLGVPLIDIQFADSDWRQVKSVHRQAFGWIAIGDRATGLLLAIGGIARGLLAIGGVAVGGISFGGLSAGGLSIGGMALGWFAVGGLGIGYDAAGGAAAGWHSAAGGGAIARHVATGGGAIAGDYAVGGSARANEVNTERAQEIVAEQSLFWLLEWQINNMTLFLILVIVFSLAPLALLKFCYRYEALHPPETCG